MADELRVHRRPQLTRPVLIAAFRGWNDGGQGASLAGGYLAKTWNAERFADDRAGGLLRLPGDAAARLARRGPDPPDRLAGERLLPRAARGLDRDAVLLLGIEPNLRWRTFTELVDRPRRELGVELVVTLGALLADVPHTRPSPVTGSATDPELFERLGLAVVALRGPDRDRRRPPRRLQAARTSRRPASGPRCRTTSRSRRARAPRSRCAGGSGSLIGIEIDTDELEEAAERYSEQVSEAVASDEETAAYVEELERRVDELEEQEDLPSGDSLAAELTRFLRERERDDGGAEPPASSQPAGAAARQPLRPGRRLPRAKSFTRLSAGRALGWPWRRARPRRTASSLPWSGSGEEARDRPRRPRRWRAARDALAHTLPRARVRPAALTWRDQRRRGRPVMPRRRCRGSPAAFRDL